MAITFIGAATANAATLTVPTHAVGDLIIFMAAHAANSTAPSLATGYTTIGTGTKVGGTVANAVATRIGFKIATATNDSSGTWTNAGQLECLVYRPGTANTIAIGNSASANGTATTATIPGMTLANISGSSWVVGFVASNTATSITGTATGMSSRGDTTLGTGRVAEFDTNAGVTTWASGSSVTVATGNWVGWSVEILEIQKTFGYLQWTGKQYRPLLRR